VKAWFMYDNHCFASVELGKREAIIKRVTALFAEDGCGSLFARDDADATLHSLTLHGQRMGNGKWGVSAEAIEEWADSVLAEKKFRTYMDA
jgi:hypothetical protein